MVSTDEIYSRFECERIPQIDIKSKHVLDECYDLLAPLLESKLFSVHPTNKLIRIKKQFIYDSDYCEYFFKILNDQGYNPNEEIKQAIADLRPSTSNELDNYVVLRYLNSPYIDSIESLEHGFKINSTKLGEYAFDFADHYYHDKPQITDYIHNEQLRNRCHHHVDFLTEENPSLYAVTSLIETMYKGYNFYHSYCWDKSNNKIIDLTSNMVMDKAQYDQLFKCEELLVVEGGNLKEAATIAKQTCHSLKTKVNPLASALFQQYIWENNLTSPDKDIFTEQPKNKQLLIKNRFGSTF